MTDKAKVRLMSAIVTLYLVAAWGLYVVGFFGVFGYDGATTRIDFEPKLFLGLLLALISGVFIAAMVPDRRRVR